MRELHVLGVSDDGDALLLGPSSGKASHRVPLDDRLRAAARGALAVPSSDRAEITLSPKEIQSRLRAGETPEEVAKAAQVPVARVLPYAVPVIAERQRIVDDARAAYLHRNRGPAGERPLGETVDAHLNDVPGLRPDTVEWSARRRRDAAWIVTLTYAARGGRRSAAWLWRPLERDLTALDLSGSRLAADEGGAPRRRPATRKPAAAKKAAAKKRPAAKKAAPKKRPAVAKAVAKKAAVKKAAAAKRAAAKRPAARKVAKPAPRKAVVKKAPARKVAAKKAPTRKPAAAKAPVRKAPARRPTLAKVASVAQPVVRRPAQRKAQPQPPVKIVKIGKIAPVVAVPVEVPVEEPVVRPAPQPVVARRPGVRVPVPSWSDVLLGVQVAPREDAARQTTPGRRRRKSG